MERKTLLVHQIPNTQILLYLNVPHANVAAFTQDLSNGSLPSPLWFDTSATRAGIRSKWGTTEGRTHLFQFTVSLDHIKSALFDPEEASKLQITWETFSVGTEDIHSARIGIKQPIISQFLARNYWPDILDISHEWTNLRSAYNQGHTLQSLNFDLISILSSPAKQALGIRIPVVKNKKSTKVVTPSEETITNKKPSYPVHKLYNRILHDPTVDSELFSIGYLDRFSGVIEVPFQNYVTLEGELNYNTGVPFHRIQFFKYRGHIVFDRKSHLDLISGNKFLQFEQAVGQ